MNKVWLIIQREYLTRVRKKSFIIMTILGPLGFVLFFIFLVVAFGQSETKKKIAVVNESGYDIVIRDTTNLYFAQEDTSLGYLELVYKQKGYDGILHIPPIRNTSRPNGIEYRSEDQLGIVALTHIESQLTNEMREIKIREANLDKTILTELNETNVQVRQKTLGEEGETEVNAIVSAGVGYAMGLIIYITMFIYGSMVMRGVAEEKTNRVVEIIISSVKPFQLMLGKIIGIGAVSITQFALWAILITITQFVFGIIFYQELSEVQQMLSDPTLAQQSGKEELAKSLAALANINFTAIFLYFIFYFIGGYLLYGALFAAVGAAANEQDDMQALNLIISIPIIISMFIMMKVVQDPNTPLAFWASVFPFTSPIVMMARIPFNPPFWQILLSMVLLIGGFIFSTWLAGKVYRVGILMYGKRISIREIGRWLFYK
ncbi:MAG: ABC transporter permease [Chitinophagales bacterium]|nr:ABC transporter permease [Chitinophagales bacterium]